ncbi:hypothetical protein JTE90_017918 [Oedothorax gibbosus]|uniref:Uncharacterized protein n=1 Tax=Oedothorax gibbosus TaxID=931172 RepID=A0AAV6VIC3_9ARAC|nr:hypothetical protein JTE90_017918 [Oedothorax gibbosus]
MSFFKDVTKKFDSTEYDTCATVPRGVFTINYLISNRNSKFFPPRGRQRVQRAIDFPRFYPRKLHKRGQQGAFVEDPGKREAVEKRGKRSLVARCQPLVTKSWR